MEKQLLLTFVFVLFSTLSLIAQSKTVTGKVTDANTGEGLPGVNVTIKGTRQGTATDIDGTFALTVPRGAVLVFSYVGMKTQEILTDSQSYFDIRMLETSLTEVVISAQGIRKEKKNLGYAVSTIDGGKIQEKSESDLGRVLRGKVSGMDVTQTSGVSGSGTNIIIRGYTSVSGSNQPLFIVDGVPFDSQTNTQGDFQDGQTQSSRFLDLDPNNIESVNVLKGLSATVLYGDMGRNGVVVITTKTGSYRKTAKKTEVTLTQSLFANKIASLPNYQDKYGGGFYQNSGFFFSNWGPAFSEVSTINHPYSKFQSPALIAAFPEYQGATYAYKSYNSVPKFFRTGIVASTSLNVRGGGPKTSYSVSYGYYDDKGFTPGNNLIRNTFNFGGRTILANGLTVGTTLNFASTKYSTPPIASSQGSGSNGTSSIFGDVFYTPRSVDLMGLPFENPITKGSVYYRSSNDIQNPRWTVKNAFNRQVVDRFFGQINATYKFNDNLELMYRIGLDQYTEQNEIGQNKGGVDGNINGIYTTYSVSNRISNHDLILTYNKKLTESIVLSSILGFNARRDTYDRQGIASSQQTVYGVFRHFNFQTQSNNFPDRLSTPIHRSDFQNRLGVYLQANFSYDNYLFLNLVGRNDWSSTLEVANNSIFYPGISLAFDATSAIDALKESFVLSYLKLRVGYGSSANFPDAFSTRTTLDLDTRNFQTNGGVLVGVNQVSNTLGNPDLKPERLSEVELGLEVQLFKNKIGFDVSVFSKRTTNLLNAQQLIDPASGYTTQSTNAGEIKVEGIELESNIKVLSIGSFRWNVLGVFTAIKNKVVSLAEKQVIIAGFTNRGNIAKPGYPFGALFGPKVQRNENGRRIVQSNGQWAIDGTSDIIGNPQSDWNTSLTNTFAWKGLTLSFEWQYQKGGDILSISAATLVGRGITKDTDFDRRQTFILPGQVNKGTADAPNWVENTIQLSATDLYFNVLGFGADEFKVYDATHLRLNEVSLSYTLPKSLIEKTPFGMVQFTLSGYNLWYNAFNFPKHTNVDPNSNGIGVGNGRGIEFLSSPSSKRFGGSIKMTF